MEAMVTGLLAVISAIAVGVLDILVSLFTAVVGIFWSTTDNAPTFLGVLVLFAVAVPIVYWVVNFVIGLIRKIRLTRG